MFDFGIPMFVMECLAHVLDNVCKAGVMYLNSYDDRVDTEVNRINMQRCITCIKNPQKGAKTL